MLKRRDFFKLTGAFAAVSALSACGNKESEQVEAPAENTSKKTAANVGALKGPTAIGLASFMDLAKQDKLNYAYKVSVAGSPDDMLAEVVSGSVDFALLPANMAAALYNKTEQGISVININTLGVLQLLSTEGISRFDEISGKKLINTGRGASPEYAFNFLLEKKGLTDSVSVDYASEPSEVVGRLVQEGSGTCILPEPFATAALAKVEGLKKVVSLSEVWDSVVDDGSKLIQGVTIVRNDYLAEHEDVVKDFLEAHAESSKTATDDPEAAADILVKEGIFDSVKLIAKAIPDCGLASTEGVEMKEALSGYLAVLAAANKKSVGGKLPEDNFYYGA